MFRGRPRRGGSFPWDFHPHGPPSGPVEGLRGPISGRSPQGHVHPLHRESYLEDRNRERIGYHHGYHTDSEKLRRSPPRGRLPSPGLRSTWGPGGGPSSSEPFVKVGSQAYWSGCQCGFSAPWLQWVLAPDRHFCESANTS